MSLEECRDLFLAVANNEKEKVIDLMMKVKNLKLLDSSGYTLLIIATVANRIECLRYLLPSLRLLVNWMDIFGWTALSYAVHNDNKEALELLVKYGGNIHQRTTLGLTLAHICCLKNSTTCLYNLLTKGIDINLQTMCGQTPLHFAVHANNVSIVRILMTHGALVGIRDDLHSTPLHIAIRLNHKRLIPILRTYPTPKTTQTNTKTRKFRKKHFTLARRGDLTRLVEKNMNMMTEMNE
ncbi:hypothetical protein SNEBB_009123 [Seison nebaliae]|nr:hypothetical protein SNEBB_009123 [Seison nebaliae]